MKYIIILLALLILPGVVASQYTQTSVELLDALQTNASTQEYVDQLASITPEQLRADLNSTDAEKAFWINIYNAYIQLLLTENPELFEDRNSVFGYNFFSTPQITIAGELLSFDDIEHGIMRRSKIKLSLGYLNNPFVDNYEKLFRWDQVDERIHFALNCGAASCPKVATYTPQRVEEQLDITTQNHLMQTSRYDSEKNTVYVTSLMSWFRADFSGKHGTREILKEYEIIPQDSSPKIRYATYNWTLDIGNYQEI